MSVRALRRGAIAASRVQAPATVTALSLPGSAGNYASTPTGPSITADIDVRIRVALADWTPSSNMIPIAKWPTASNRSYRILLLTSGNVQFDCSSDGLSADMGSGGFASGFSDGTTGWLRGTRIKSTGVTSIYKSTDGSSWTLLGSATVSPGTAIHNGSSAVEVGSLFEGSTLPLNGTVRYAEIRSGIDGTVVAKFDPSGVAILGTRNPTSFVSSTGETWTINGSSWNWVTI